MSGLTSALSSALSGLLVTSTQSNVTSRNVTRASDPDYSREQAVLTTNLDGSVRVTGTQRAASKQLTDALLQANSNSSAQSSILDAYNSLSATVGDVQDDGSVAWGINQLQQALQSAEFDPSNTTLATQAVTTASGLASILNGASSSVETVREQADAGIATSVATVNTLLAQFQTLDNSIASGTLSGDQKASAQDQRDAVLKQISAEIGIRTTQRSDGSMAIYTDGGVTLYDRTARKVTFTASPTLAAASTGQAVYADGVPITGASSPMPSNTGRIAALAKVRDEIAPTYQNQLDEIARTLITTFSEKDQGTPATQPDATGLFSYAGSPTVPASGTLVPGLAASIKINAAFDVSAGGNAFLLRDGGANGAAYTYNSTGVVGYQSRLASLITALGQPQTFSSATKLSTTNTLAGLATDSAGWVEGGRSTATTASTAASATASRAQDALLSATGVSLDTEMANLLSIEKSYQASAKVLTTVNQMLGDLMNSVN